MTQGNHPCFIVASLLDGVNNMVYFHAKYGMVTDDGSITNDIDMGMLTRKLWWWWWLIIWLYVVERMMDDHFLRMLSWLSWWKICFHQHWTMQTPRKISKRWWLVVGWTGSLGNDAWEDAAVERGLHHASYGKFHRENDVKPVDYWEYRSFRQTKKWLWLLKLRLKFR